MSMILLLALLSTSNAYAVAPLVPVYAADHAQVTNDSMRYESQQFRSMAKWKSAVAQLEAAELLRDQSKKNFERESNLFKSGSSSESAVLRAERDYLNSEEMVVRLNGSVNLARATAEVNQLLILESGNPGVDNRRQIAQSTLVALLSEKKNQQAALSNATSAKAYYDRRLENGKILFEKGTISSVEYERRQLEAKAAGAGVASIKFELDGIESSIVGIEKTQARIGKP